MQLPHELSAHDDINAAARAVVERMLQVVLAQHHAISLKMARPVAAGFDQSATGDGVLLWDTDMAGIELAVVEHHRPPRPFVAEIYVIAEARHGVVEANVVIAVVE